MPFPAVNRAKSSIPHIRIKKSGAFFTTYACSISTSSVLPLSSAHVELFSASDDGLLAAFSLLSSAIGTAASSFAFKTEGATVVLEALTYDRERGGRMGTGNPGDGGGNATGGGTTAAASLLHCRLGKLP
jgi:hypothetical protein